MRSFKQVVTWGLVLLSILLIAVITARMPHFVASKVTLASGETLILRGATYGTRHSAPGTGWLRLLPASCRKILPAFFTRGQLFSDFGSSSPVLNLRLEVRSGGVKNRLWQTNVVFLLQDEQGHVAGGRESIFLNLQPQPFGRDVSFYRFPRFGRLMDVLIVQGPENKPEIVGRWQIQNPGYSPVSSWQAEPLPARQQSENLECTLETLYTGVSPIMVNHAGTGGRARHAFRKAIPGEETGAVFTAKLRELGAETNFWDICRVTLVSEAKNTITVLPIAGYTYSREGNTASFSWSPVLWPQEVWELHIMAIRGTEASFAANEIAQFTDVVVSGADTTINMNQSIQVNGVTLQARQFILRHPANSEHWSPKEVSEIDLLVTGLTQDVFLRVLKAIDEQGRTYACDGEASRSSPNERAFLFSKFPPDVKRLSFAFAISRVVPFTFRVKPDSKKSICVELSEGRIISKTNGWK